MEDMPQVKKRCVRRKFKNAVEEIMDKMERSCWEDLPIDLLLKIFQLLPPTDTIFGASQCCSGWYQASKDLVCWQVLDFRNYQPKSSHSPEIQLLDFYRVLRFSIQNRSRGSSLAIYFPLSLLQLEEDIIYIASRCPKLKYFSATLGRPMYDTKEESVCAAISTLKDLEGMDVDGGIITRRVLEAITKNCTKFTNLKSRKAVIDEEKALTICSSLPRLQSLDLSGAEFTSWTPLLTILRGCKQLRYLDISSSYHWRLSGFWEIYLQASRLEEFRWDNLLDKYNCPNNIINNSNAPYNVCNYMHASHLGAYYTYVDPLGRFYLCCIPQYNLHDWLMV